MHIGLGLFWSSVVGKEGFLFEEKEVNACLGSITERNYPPKAQYYSWIKIAATKNFAFELRT